MAELTRRYVVMRMASEAPFDRTDPDGVFVLRPWKDPAALRALQAYRDHCYPELASDVTEWIRVIEAGPAVRGDVGRRNEPYASATQERAARGRGTARRPAAGRATAGKRPASPAKVRSAGRRATPRGKKRRR